MVLQKLLSLIFNLMDICPDLEADLKKTLDGHFKKSIFELQYILKETMGL
jgi:hypothetical protein